MSESESDLAAAKSPVFQIFRANEAPTAEAAEVMYYDDIDPEMQIRIEQLVGGGVMDGVQSKVLFSFPGFSLIHFWFKCGFPLPLHAHNVDCLYYVVAGSTRVGTETLGPGDGLFVPKDVPYTHKPGADGVEILEFRHEEHFSFRYKPKSDSQYWDRALETIRTNMPKWLAATPPSAPAPRTS